LAGHGLGEHLFGQDLAEVEQELFDLGKLGSPGRPVSAVELVDEVFGHALDIGPHFFHLRSALSGVRHLEVLSSLASKMATSLPQPV